MYFHNAVNAQQSAWAVPIPTCLCHIMLLDKLYCAACGVLMQGANSSSSSRDGSSLSPPVAAKGGRAAKDKAKQQQQQQQQQGAGASSWKALSDLLARKSDRVNHLQVGLSSRAGGGGMQEEMIAGSCWGAVSC